MSWTEITFILKSKNRLAILKELEKKPANPAAIAKALNNHRSTISKVISELTKKQYLECVNPNDPTFRLYRLTTRGKQILDRIRKLEKK